MSTVLPTSSPSFIKSKKYPTSTSIPSAVTPTSTPTTTTPITATSSSMTTTSTLRQPPFPSYTSKSGVKETFVTPSSSKPTPNGLPTSSRYGRSRDRRTQNKGSSLLSSTIHTLVLDPGRHQHQSQGQVKEKEVKDEIEYAPILKGQSLQDEPVFPTLLHIPDVTIDQVRPSLEDLIFSRPSNTHFDPFFINPPEDPLSSTDFHVDLEFLQPPPQPSSMPHRLVPTVSDPCPPPNKKDEDEDDGKRKVTSVLPNRAPETENEDQVVVEIEKKEDDEEPLPMFLFATEPDTTPSPPPLDGTPPLPPTTVCPSSPVLTEHGTPILRRRPRPPPPSRPSNISPLPTWTPSGPQKDNARQDETQVLDRTPSCSPLAKSHPLLPVHAEQPDPAPPTDEPETNGKDHHGNPPLFGPQGPSPSSSLRWNHLVNKPHGVPCDDTLNEQKRRGTKEDEEET
ncbi:hypothetical protein HMI56_002254 [Coelomomyces lativittatus]|nr:hypothetical protein HMI56_002254 [Coelomomyces lativittatus]